MTDTRFRTTGGTRATSCCKIAFSSRTHRGACRSTCSWSPSGRRGASSIGDPMSCINEVQEPDYPPDFRSSNPRFRAPPPGRPDYAWTDLTYLLHAQHVSWAYYVMAGTQPDCANGDADCGPVPAAMSNARNMESVALFRHGQARRRARQHPRSARVLRGGAGRHAAERRLDPPAGPYSEHPPALVSRVRPTSPA